jgi:hypothetical protein
MSYTLTRLTLKTRLEPRDVSVLTHADAALKLSLYLPFDRSWRESQEGKVLLRDLRRRAAADLERRGALSGGVDAVLSPIDSLLAEPDASRFDGEGLALFSDGEKSTALLLAKAPRASAEIDVAYRLDGILTQIFERDRYYLLHLSQHAIRLWECDGVSMNGISLEGMETDIRATPHFQGTEFQSVFHTSGSGHHGRLSRGQDSSYSGIGVGDDRELKKEIAGFFRQVDRGIRARIPDPRFPLILTGAGYLLPIYREVSAYPFLPPGDLPGQPDSMDRIAELRLRANALMEEARRAERNARLGRFVETLARPRSSAGYTDVVPCAAYGRLTDLFLAEGGIQWGEFDTATGRTAVYDAYRDGAIDLANLACASAIRGGAKVFALPAAEMPGGAPIAGLVRA